MHLQVVKLIVWPKNTTFAPRELDFEPGRVNVITGASRTGKSAIIPIIDYCLGSSDCHVPIDTIRTHAAWYGIIASTETGQLLVARRVPSGSEASDEFFYIEGTRLSVPPSIEKSNEKLSGVKMRLNALANTPSFKLNEEDQGYTARLSFRDVMALIFQSQDIVANQNTLFYKTHAHKHRERLRNWFPYILGAETLDTLRARNRLKVVERELRRLRNEFDAKTSVSATWQGNLIGHLRVADEYGLLDDAIPEGVGFPVLVSMARDVLEAMPDASRVDTKSVLRANAEVARLESEEREMSLRIGDLKKRMGDLQRLKDGFQDYRGTVARRVERLHLSKWIADVASNGTSCPFCGSSEHPRAERELAEIRDALALDEASVRAVSSTPTTLIREETNLKNELDEITAQRKALQVRYDLVMARDQEARKETHRRKEMHVFIGHLKASLEAFDQVADGSDIRGRIANLEKERRDMRLESCTSLGALKS